MAIYIDGFNLLKSKGFSGDKVAQMEQLIIYISTNFPKSETIHLVFDGYKAPVRNEHSFIKIHYSGSKTADDLLFELIKKTKNPQVAITSDKELGSRLVKLGTTVKKSTEIKFPKTKKNIEKKIPFDSQLFDELYLLNHKGLL
ncbi:MAG: NYN domain-containing protein [Bacteroidetes bacterium]|nr:NYN domain-containing protein [Bacteroidota bacterium]NCQ10913.1 NYN domain-containing protein [Bacteroidota bacterium]